MSPASPPPFAESASDPSGPTPWVAPDQPAGPPPAREPEPPLPAPAGDVSGVPVPAPASADGRRRGDGRTTTVVLSVFAVVVLAVCGFLGVAGVLVNLPVHPFADPPVAEEPQQDAPSDPDADQPATRPAPTPTPTRKPASTPSNGPGRFAVAYAVTGQGQADILYRDADGYLIWLDGVALPWHHTVHTDAPNQLLLQAGKADDKGGRTIICAVVVDGGRRVTETVGPGGWRCGVGG
ncbi:MAG: MmpS family transport accessory protein [Micromonospora sp.]